MQATRNARSVRLFCASIPSAALSLSICVSLEPAAETLDVLILTSDFYAGTSPDEYESVMKSLAGDDHAWAKVVFCNGLSRALAFAGRKPAPTSFVGRTLEDLSDARMVNKWSDDLLKEVLSAEQGVSTNEAQPFVVEEVWADITSDLARLLFAKYKNARKTLYPHSLNVVWGKRPDMFFSLPAKFRDGPGRPLLRTLIRKTGEPFIPLVMAPRYKEIVFDKAYTFRSELYLAKEVVDKPKIVRPEIMRKACHRLPREAQSYFAQLGARDKRGIEPAILFLPASREPKHFEPEVTALVRLLQATAAVRREGPVVLKPHPRGNEDYLRKMCDALRAHCPATTFRSVDRWAAVPIEVGSSTWDISCCMGLATSAAAVMNWIFGVPAYMPLAFLREIYADDPASIYDVESIWQSESRFLIAV